MRYTIPMALILDMINVNYPGLEGALKDVSLEIASGEFVVLCAPPGSGKTTLIRSVCGLDPIASGEVWLEGVSLKEIAVKDRNFFLYSSAHAFDRVRGSVYKNLAKGLKLRKLTKSEIDIKIDNAAEVLGLSGMLKTNIKKLDTLNRFKVSLARALLRDVSVVFLDEPLLGVEEALHQPMLDCVLALHKKLGVIFMYATMEWNQAEYLNARTALLHYGKLKQVGSVEALTQNPTDEYVAQFIKINASHPNLG